MKHTVTRRVATGALSAVLALSSLPAPAIAEAAGRAALAAQAEPQGAWRHDGYRWTFALQAGGLATGWQQIGGAWYLFDGSGTMLTGWQNPSGSWYYLSESGAMSTGWLRWNHAWYWLAPESGRMHQSQWLHEGGEWYYFDGSGAMATGWRQVGGKWYFLQESGAMAHDGYTDDQYWVGSDGAWVDSPAYDLDEETAQLTCTDLFDPAATSATFTITSDEAHPFAERLGAASVSLLGDFADMEVTGVERTDAHTARVSVKGPLPAEGAREGSGAVYFDKGSFADAQAFSLAAVVVRHEDAALLVDESSYDEATGAFRIAVDAGSAQLAPGASASLPADASIEVQGVEPSGPGTLVVTAKVPGATPYAQLVALDTALYEGGLTVTGTNAGDVTARFSEEQVSGIATYLSPSAYFYVERGADGKGWTLDADGGATVSLRLRMVAESGDFDLTYADLGLVADGVEDEGGRFVDDNTYEFVAASLTADELAELMASFEYGAGQEAEFLDTYAYVLGAQVAEGIELLGGATDEWGIELPADYKVTLNAYNNVGLGATSGVEEVAEEGELETQATDARYNEVKKAKKAMEAVKHLSTALSMAGAVIGLLATTGPVGAVIGAIVGIIGVLAEVLMPKGFTVEDAFNEMGTLNSQLEGISGQIGDINSQLEALDADIDYKTRLVELRDYVGRANAYKAHVVKALNATKGAADKDSFNIMTDDYKSSPTGMALYEYYRRTTFQDKLTGKGENAFNIATHLADMIVGNMGQQGVVQSFFDYTASKVNWEPETYYQRDLFVSYVGGAFFYAYSAANIELKWQLREETNETKRAVIEQNMTTLAEKAAAVSRLIGTVDDSTGKTVGEGLLLAGTHDRTDGKVLCTVNGRLYEKATSQGTHPAVYHALLFSSWDSFNFCFDELFKDPYNEDKGQPYINENTLSLANLNTMASRLPYVRTLPGFDGQEGTVKANSIYDELIAVGLLLKDPTESKGSKDKDWEKLTKLTWDTSYQFQYAVVSNSSLRDQSNMSSVYHKRWHNAEMYDIKSNSYAGSKEIFYYETWYKVGHGWRVEAEVKTPLYFRAS